MTIDPRTPVIIGVAQLSQRPVADDDLRNAPDPIELMATAVRKAATDAGGASVLDTIDSVSVIGGLWRYKNPGALVVDELGLDPSVHTILTSFGGNLPIHHAHVLAERIASGETEMAVLTGGECNLTRRNLAKRGEEQHRRSEERPDAVENWGPPLDMGDRTSIDRGGEVPRNSYAVLESAIRASRGESLDTARDRAAALWAGYAAVATRNPHAADRRGLTVQRIRAPAADNRMVSWPYTKAMCANNNVDQAAALVMTSVATADRLAVPAERRVHPRLCVTSEDTTTLLERAAIASAPGLDAAAATLLAEIGPPNHIDHLDLYSCFPSLVTLTTAALGIDPSRELTVTGGLAFAGAPLNLAAGQALVAMVDRLRADPGSTGVVQGNGGHATKHAFGIYSTTAPTEPHRLVDIGLIGEAVPVASPDRIGPATLEGVTVEYNRDGPNRAVAIVRFDDGARSWANSDDPNLMARFVSEECVGQRVDVAKGTMARR